MDLRNIAMIVSYDGTSYYGFQSQPAGNTIQDELQIALRRLTHESIKVEGSGRTDAGVHANGQVISFRTASPIPIQKWTLAINSWLPNDIVVRSAHEMPDDFHARFSAIRKTYRYSLTTGKYPNVFTTRYRHHHYNRLNVEAMRAALPDLLGEHDFTSFTSGASTKSSHIRAIFEARLEEEAGDLHLYLTGSGFLYNMVRIIMGTLLRIGEGKWPPDCIPSIIEAKHRQAAGPRAVAQGLMLWEVGYPEPHASALRHDPANAPGE